MHKTTKKITLNPSTTSPTKPLKTDLKPTHSTTNKIAKEIILSPPTTPPIKPLKKLTHKPFTKPLVTPRNIPNP